MENKKIIGLIIGILLFGALIAGATFAWFTTNVRILNGNFVNAKTTNFIVNYTKGTAISAVPILDTGSSDSLAEANFATGTSGAGGKIVVKAKRNTNDADGNLDIYLHTTESADTTTITTAQGGTYLLRYAVCAGTAACTLTGTAATTVTSATTGLIAKGSITTTGAQKLVTVDGIATSDVTYNIYLWIDQEFFYTYTDIFAGKSYSGYVYAEATQD